MNITEF